MRFQLSANRGHVGFELGERLQQKVSEERDALRNVSPRRVDEVETGASPGVLRENPDKGPGTNLSTTVDARQDPDTDAGQECAANEREVVDAEGPLHVDALGAFRPRATA